MRKRDIKEYERIKQLRDEYSMTFREIARVVEKSVSTVHYAYEQMTQPESQKTEEKEKVVDNVR